jgi:hypothetical protein
MFFVMLQIKFLHRTVKLAPIDKIFREMKSTYWINLWSRDGTIHVQYPKVAWEKKKRKYLSKPGGGNTSLTFYERKDLKDRVEPEISRLSNNNFSA